MMQVLAAGGCPPLIDNVRGADESNPRGYFEFEVVKKLRVDHSWLDQARGRAVKVIHALLRELPADGRFQYRVLLMKRPIEEVIASQRVMLARQGKASADEATLTKIFQAQLADVERSLTDQTHFSVLPVSHHRLFSDPIVVAGEVNEFLGGELDVAAMAGAVDPLLYRQRGAAKSDADRPTAT